MPEESPPPRLQPGVEVVITPVVETADSRTTDAAGLASAVLELALADLPGVVPRGQATPVHPAFVDMARTADRTWTLDLNVAADTKIARIEASICPEDQPCELVETSMNLEDPGPGLSDLIARIEAEMDRPAPEEAVEARLPRGTEDPYALRLAGRSAAVLHGLLPAPAKPWDKRADPVQRAVLVDPSLPAAAWPAGRMALVRGAPERVSGLVQRASLARPSSTLLRSLSAIALADPERPRAAERAWLDLIEDHPQDPRFLVPAARACLAAGHSAQAESLLLQVPESARTDPAVAELRAVAASGGDPMALEARLAEWAEADRQAPEPVHQRILLRVRGDRFEGALELVPELRSRGATEQADSLEVALLAALSRWDEVAKRTTDEAIRAGAAARASY